jgi:small GTP-binding protein
MGECTERLRLVFLGLSQTGKTSVIKRFLFKTFNERYKPTVEELYYREFDLGHIKLKVDIMDTAGDFAFPAMRRLAIAGANAFVLMYSIDNVQSLDVVKQSFEEIREERKDFAEIPVLFVGNKSDLVNRKEVFKEDVCEWVFCELPKIR